jgi:hypothetical protein
MRIAGSDRASDPSALSTSTDPTFPDGGPEAEKDVPRRYAIDWHRGI